MGYPELKMWFYFENILNHLDYFYPIHNKHDFWLTVRIMLFLLLQILEVTASHMLL